MLRDAIIQFLELQALNLARIPADAVGSEASAVKWPGISDRLAAEISSPA